MVSVTIMTIVKVSNKQVFNIKPSYCGRVELSPMYSFGKQHYKVYAGLFSQSQHINFEFQLTLSPPEYKCTLANTAVPDKTPPLKAGSRYFAINDGPELSVSENTKIIY